MVEPVSGYRCVSRSDEERSVAMLRIEVDLQGASDADLDLLTRQLRLELLRLDVDDVVLPSDGQAPPGAKGDAVTVGTLVVSIANSATLSGLIVGLCQVLRTWVGRGSNRRVVVRDRDRELELSGATVEQHQQIIDAFLEKLCAETEADEDDHAD
jgi:hypothetical protein